ncbi:MAG: N-acetyltransferase family protein [Hyphomicrobiaceae bacterium]
MSIRDAEERDLVAITELYNDVVRSSTATFNDQPASLEARGDWLAARRARSYPVLVAEFDGAFAGFASFGDFRAGPGYRHTVEHTVYVSPGVRGRSLGTLLMKTLFARALALDKHVMVGAIDAANEASIRFHELLGFQTVGHMTEVGRKFNRWLDLVLMQRTL